MVRGNMRVMRGGGRGGMRGSFQKKSTFSELKTPAIKNQFFPHEKINFYFQFPVILLI
jgi:hypothetical protein